VGGTGVGRAALFWVSDWDDGSGGRAVPRTERTTRGRAAPGIGRRVTPHDVDYNAKAVLGEGSSVERRRH
jgi:hypothetical protein